MMMEKEDELKIAEEAWDQEKQSVLDEMHKMDESVKQIEQVNESLQ